MKKFLFSLAACLPAFLLLSAAETVRLWDGDAPGAKGKRPCDIPTLTVYLPDNPAGKRTPAVIVCPGGAYSFHAVPSEGTAYAKFLNENGIATFVLKYRLGSSNNGAYRYPVPQMDARRAVKLIRKNAALWKIDPRKVGIMGSSAGGHLTAMTAVQNDNGDPKSTDPVEKFSSRPDFAILCYAQTSMDSHYGACAGSKALLIGNHAGTENDVAAYKLVDDMTPPCFIWHTFEDQTVPVRNALDMANALEANMVPFSLHIYHNGRHGMGLGNPRHIWTSDLLLWLKEIGVLRK